MRFLVFAFAAAFACGTAAADSAAEPVAIKDISKYLNYQRDLRDDMKRDSKFKHVDESSKEKLFTAQDQIFAVLQGKSSTQDLTPNQKIELYNAQEQINAILTDADLDRPVCKRERRIGSNRLETTCTTKRELDLARSNSREVMIRNRTCAGAECSGN